MSKADGDAAWLTALPAAALEHISEEIDDLGPRNESDEDDEGAAGDSAVGASASGDPAERSNTLSTDEHDEADGTTKVLAMLKEDRRESALAAMERIRSQKLSQGASRRSLASLRHASASVRSMTSSSHRSSNASMNEAIIDSLLVKDVNDLSAAEFQMLEDEFAQYQQRTDEMRDKLSQHQEFRQAKRAQELQDELDTIDARVDAERLEREKLEAHLQTLRESEAAYALQDDSLENELHEMELQHQLENVAMLRIKADKLRRQREQLESTERARKVEIDAILEEHGRRNVSGEATLKRLLHRVDALQKELQAPEYKEDPAFEREMNATFALTGDPNAAAPNQDSDFARLFDKVAQVREERWEGKLRALEGELSELCEERARLAAEEQELVAKRKRHDDLLAQGLDFLVELELGNAPPADYVLANMQARKSNQEDDEDPDADADTKDVDGLDGFDMEHLADRVERGMQLAQTKIDSYKIDLETLDKERQWVASDTLLAPHEKRAYDGSLGPASYPESLRSSYYAVRGIVADAIDVFLDTYTPTDAGELRHEAEKAMVKWKASGSMLERRINDEDRESAVRMVADGIIQSTLETVLRGIFGEVQTARVLSQKIADKLILGSVFSLWQGGGAVPEEVQVQVSSTFGELQRRRENHDRALLEHSRIPMTLTSLKLEKAILPQEVSVFYSTNAAYSKASMARIREELMKKRMREQDYEKELVEKRLDLDDDGPSGLAEGAGENGNKGGEESDSENDGDDEEDEDATPLQFAMVQTLEPGRVAKRAPDFRRVEKNFWNGVSFRSKHIKVRRGGNPSAIAGSSGGDYLAVGTDLGRVFVYDVRPEKEALLLRKFQPRDDASPIVQMVWSTDVGTLLLVLDEAGTVRLLSTLAAPERSSRSHAWDKLYKALPLEVLLELTWRDFDRPVQENLYAEAEDIEQYKAKVRANQRKRKQQRRGHQGPVEPSEKDLQPVHVAFHTAHTLLGVQLSIMIALQNGDIVKWNTDHAKPYGDRSIYCPSHAHVEPQNPRDGALLPGQPRPKGDLFGSTIRREFFQSHKTRPIFMGFVNRCSEIMYTLDSKMRMRLWPYEPSQFSGFGWFVPLQRFTLDLRDISYSADRAFPVEKVFPPAGVEVPAAPTTDNSTPRSATTPKSRFTVEEDVYIQLNESFVGLAREEERLVATLGLQDRPWLVRETGEKQRVMQIFAPEDAPVDKSSPHHVLIHSKGGVLVQHMISYFAPTVAEGILEDVSLSHAGSEILFLVRYPSTAEKPGTVRIYVYDTVTLGLEPTAVEIVMEGKIRPQFAVSPLLKDVGSDYVYVLMNSSVLVVSLTSGLYATQRLSPLGKTSASGSCLTDIVLLRDHEHLACIGPKSDTVYLFAIESPAQSSDAMQRGAQRLHRPRMDHSPRECDV